MEAGGWRGYGVTLLGVDGLIALAVGGVVFPFDVRRQRDVAEAFEGLVKAGFAGETDDATAEVLAFFDYAFELAIAEDNSFADWDFAAGAD